MNWRVLGHITLVVVLSLLQISLISSLPIPFNSINIILVTLLFLLLFDDLAMLLSWLVISGFVLSIFSYLPFGLAIIALWITILFCYFLFYQVLTNRSLYSLLILVVIANFLNQLTLHILLWLNKVFTGQSYYLVMNFSWFKNIFISTALDVLAMICIFYLMHFLNPRLKPFLLLKK